MESLQKNFEVLLLRFLRLRRKVATVVNNTVFYTENIESRNQVKCSLHTQVHTQVNGRVHAQLPTGENRRKLLELMSVLTFLTMMMFPVVHTYVQTHQLVYIV